jgi:type I restriction enzyme S subunit
VSISLRKAKLIEIAELNPRLSESPDGDELVSFIPMSAVTAESASTTTGEDRPYGEVSKGYTHFLNGDVLLAKITPCFENGKIAQAKLSRRIGFGSTEFHVVRPRAGKADARYLMHFLRQEHIRLDGARKMTGSAGQRRVPDHFLAGLEVSAPPLAEQRRIAEVLDRAEALRAKRRAALAQLDTLTQSIFLDRFGDPTTNPKGITVVRLSDVTTRITDGVHQKPDYTESGVPFISVKDITTGVLSFNECKFIGREDHNKFTKRCRPEKGDILYTKVGATYGRPALVDTEREFSIYVSVCLIKPQKKLVDPMFLCATLGTTAVKGQADKRIKGIGVPDLHLDQIQSFLIPLPSLSVQADFARCVVAVEKAKAIHRASLAELDALFAVLQLRAFRGEL